MCPFEVIVVKASNFSVRGILLAFFCFTTRILLRSGYVYMHATSTDKSTVGCKPSYLLCCQTFFFIKVNECLHHRAFNSLRNECERLRADFISPGFFGFGLPMIPLGGPELSLRAFSDVIVSGSPGGAEAFPPDTRRPRFSPDKSSHSSCRARLMEVKNSSNPDQAFFSINATMKQARD